MSNTTSRRDRRYAIALPVTVLARSGDTVLFTEDVSYRGMFIRTEQPFAKLQLLRVRVAAPGLDFAGHVVVAHLTAPGANVPGMGVSFFGWDQPRREAWERFVDSLQTTRVARERPASPADRREPSGVFSVAAVSPASAATGSDRGSR